jgi:S-adenosylmethionine/arginine decarboxylase-like enzyme
VQVHSRAVILGDDGLSPPGFTAVCLVDESHVTAHCYSDRGWLAIDVFTCGQCLGGVALCALPAEQAPWQ